MIIDTAFGRRSAKLKTGAGVISNAMQYLTVNSKFFQLAVGSNVLTFSGPATEIVYSERYMGL
jgi:phage-related protein